MGVPPGGSKQFCPDTIRERCTGSNRTLADGRNTIVVGSTGLQEAVPVYRRALILESVVDSDFDPVAPVGLDQRTRELVVGNKHWGHNTVWRHRGVCDSPVVVARDTCVRDLAWVVWVGVVCAPISPWEDATTRLGAIEITSQIGIVERSKRAVAWQ